MLEGGLAEYKYVIDSMESAGLIQISKEGKQIKDIRLASDQSSIND